MPVLLPGVGCCSFYASVDGYVLCIVHNKYRPDGRCFINVVVKNTVHSGRC